MTEAAQASGLRRNFPFQGARDAMAGRYVGFYWTFPVPWIGFESLGKDVEEAARKSLTIRYQRDLANRWVKDQGGVMIREGAALELRPDRGTEEILPAVGKALEFARTHEAQLLLTDFRELGNWRRHGPLREAVEEATAQDPERVQWIAPDPVPMADMKGGVFEPRRHFRRWRELEAEHAGSKPEHRAAILAHLEGRAEESLVEQAKALEAAGLKTFTGRKWDADNLRKFLKPGGG